MGKYEITDKGKVLIAASLVVVLLLIPAIVFATRSAQTPMEPEAREGQKAPEVSELLGLPNDPMPSLRPDTVSYETSNSGQDLETTDEVETRDYTIESIDSVKRLTFNYTPGSENELDSNTLAELDTFIKSRSELQDYILVIETGLIPDSSRDTIITAVTDATSRYGIRGSRIDYIGFAPEVETETIPVTLYFVSRFIK